jgi:hypothetical protein
MNTLSTKALIFALVLALVALLGCSLASGLYFYHHKYQYALIEGMCALVNAWNSWSFLNQYLDIKKTEKNKKDNNIYITINTKRK